MSDHDSVSAAAGDDASPPPLRKPSEASFSIWPPTQRTRDAVISRLVETLSAPSVVSKRYGTVAPEEADPVARLIEEEAFAAAGSSSAVEDDGIAVLQVYSREISRRMLETVKARAAPRAAADSPPEAAPASEDAQSES